MPAVSVTIRLRRPIFYPMHIAALDCDDFKRESWMTDNNGIMTHTLTNENSWNPDCNNVAVDHPQVTGSKTFQTTSIFV